MKNIIYFKSSVRNRNKGTLITLKVFQIEGNTPISLGSVTYNTASTKGEKSEVYKLLLQKGLVTQEEYNSCDGYYEISGSDYSIIELF